MSTCHSNGNRNLDFKLSLEYTCLHLGFQLEQPLWALQMDIVFSPEMSCFVSMVVA